jgi:hypothetical protein
VCRQRLVDTLQWLLTHAQPSASRSCEQGAGICTPSRLVCVAPAAGWVCHELSVLLHWAHGAVRQPVNCTDSGAGEHTHADQPQLTTQAMPLHCVDAAPTRCALFCIVVSATTRETVRLQGREGSHKARAVLCCAVLCYTAPVSREDGCCMPCAGSRARRGQGVSHKCGVHGHGRYEYMASLLP